ncbi:DUF2971 domain-containing protein [Bosea sp. TWI1241]|uniref:DUF2971 domain-containing protein n=1 Tax=Bosea sp. TWI1241 TaxID=3148904 RepID=UPI0032080771
MSAPPTIVYKYVDQEGARKVLENRTLRFGRPADMNDPFDLYIDDLFNMDPKQLQARSIEAVIAGIASDPDHLASLVNAAPATARKSAGFLKEQSSEQRAALLCAISPDMLAKEYPGLAGFWESIARQQKAIAAQYQNTGIFCATRNHNNLLMWAHYAQQHRGVVLGFRTDIEEDSCLMMLEPVRYTDTRPNFYQPIYDLSALDPSFSLNDVADIRRTLALSKSTHWMYEEELRVVLPNGVAADQPARFSKFFPKELCEMYLGCRMDSCFRAEIMEAAKSINSDIAIFDARPDKATYAMTFAPV